MRSITGFLAAAGLALSAAPAAAYASGGVTQDAYVGSHWAEVPHTGAVVAVPAVAAAQDAFVEANWDRTPASGAPSTAQAAVCTCVARN